MGARGRPRRLPGAGNWPGKCRRSLFLKVLGFMSFDVGDSPLRAMSQEGTAVFQLREAEARGQRPGISLGVEASTCLSIPLAREE